MLAGKGVLGCAEGNGVLQGQGRDRDLLGQAPFHHHSLASSVIDNDTKVGVRAVLGEALFHHSVG